MQRVLLFVVTALVLAAPASAAAQGPTQDAYGGQGNVLNEVAESNGKPGGGVAGVNAGGGSPGGDIAGVNAGGGSPGGDIAGVNAGGGSPGGNVSSSAAARPLRGDELPFTGLDVGLVAFGGMLLLALGFGVRRVSREPAT